MRAMLCWTLVPMALLAAAGARAAEPGLAFISGERRLEVVSPAYRLVVDADARALVTVSRPGGGGPLALLQDIRLEHDGGVWHHDPSVPPDLHTNRAGVYLVEAHLENLRLTDGEGAWPGVAELSIFCHRDKVHLVLDLRTPEEGWVRGTDTLTGRTRYVYEARESGGTVAAPTSLGFGLGCRDAREEGAGWAFGSAMLQGTAPGEEARIAPVRGGLTVSAAAGRVGAVLLLGATPEERAAQAALEREPLPADAVTVHGAATAQGYDPADGLWKVRGVSSSTPHPSPGQRGGAELTVRNVGPPRTVLIEQLDHWGGIAGGLLLDGDGNPLPIPIQFELNFPEFAAHGESGFAALLYPLQLDSGAVCRLSARHLFHSYRGRDLIYLNSLEPAAVNHAAILQVSIGREESHTARLGTPFHLTDFRPHFRDLEGGSASASAIDFLRYVDQQGNEQHLVGRETAILESGPALIEYAVGVASTDGAVEGTIRVWQPATSDRTRIFTDVQLRVRAAVALSKEADLTLSFLRYAVGNPMVYRSFAFLRKDGGLHAADLPAADPAPRVVANGTPMAEPFFLGMYGAANYGGKDADGNDLTISDRAGNPLMVVRDWAVTVGDRAVGPGVYAAGAGPDPGLSPGEQFRRAVAVVPAVALEELPEGARIAFRAVHVTGGDEHTDAALAAGELEAWGARWRATALHGRLLSDFPILVTAKDDRAELELTGGTDWVPVRVSGFTSLDGLSATVTRDGETAVVGADSPGEPWYNAWPEPGPSWGVTFLVRAGPSPVHIVVSRPRSRGACCAIPAPYGNTC